jgi:hypothetical protein
MFSSPIFTVTSIVSLLLLIVTIVFQIAEMKVYELLFF